MARFCGNCGSAVDDNAKVCGSCGTPLETNDKVVSKIPGVQYIDPEKKAKTAKKVKLFFGLAALIIVVVIVFNIVSGFVGYKGAVRKIMNAYEDYDIDTIVSMSSDYYYCMTDENYVEEYFGDIISEDLDDFEEYSGHNYKFSYEITDSYKMAEHKLDDLLDSLSYYEEFDADIIDKVVVVEVEVTAKSKNNDYTKELTLTLTKESGSWKLLYLY